MQDFKMLKVGQIVEGKIFKIEPNTIYIDLEAQTEGKIHLDNYLKPAPETFVGLVKVGDTVRAKIQKMTDEPAQILLSRLPLIMEESFVELTKIVEDETVVKAKVKKVQDKGLVLQYKMFEAFLPFSLLDFDLQKDKDQLQGKTIDVQMIEATRKGRRERVIASRKAIFEKARQEAYENRMQARQGELEAIKTGDVLTGIVDKVEPHAATIKFNHVIGLLRISQVSHHRIEKLSDVLKKGDEVEVKVIKKEGNRLDLSMKALLPTPYEKFASEHHVGETIEGVVVQKLPFGIIVELSLDVRGLLHRSEFSWNPNDNYDAYVKIGEEVEVSIIAIDPKKEKVGLSRKTLLDNPWKDVTVKRGDVIKAPIISIERNHLVVNVQGADGIIKQEELSMEKIGKPEEHFVVGEEVDVFVMNADKSTWTMELSIKRVKERELRADFEKFMEDEKEDEGGFTIGDLFEETLKK